MTTMQIDILNPKATKLLQDLADLDLIAIKQQTENDFLKVLDHQRTKAADNPLSLEEITEEVESVRAERYAGNKR